LVRAGDAEGVAGAVIRLLQDSGLAARMSAQGRELVEKRFSEARMIQQLDELYRRLVAMRH
jgi:glycosyltransferase involved in cell wall biosynthesis